YYRLQKIKEGAIALETNQDGELYRRNRSPGLGWLRLWEKEDLNVVLEPSGRIFFTFSDALGKLIQQTSIPQSVLWEQSK
ncbi:MAG: hypothetical protein D3916_17425, partial [Candidatus Electrothrix sp. MAN1_4]|nr:hypothetical protein [Candidatus Electrothrix sp. MAN1_4]